MNNKGPAAAAAASGTQRAQQGISSGGPENARYYAVHACSCGIACRPTQGAGDSLDDAADEKKGPRRLMRSILHDILLVFKISGCRQGCNEDGRRVSRAIDMEFRASRGTRVAKKRSPARALPAPPAPPAVCPIAQT